jgi:menaquinone-dependent protoporphyrinogen oxidase
MASIAVVFESKYGQSAKIAEHVAGIARRRGHDVKVVHASLAVKMDLEERDAFVVVGPVYFGKQVRALDAFVRARADLLSKRPSAFLSVSGSAGSRDPRIRAEAARIALEFARQTGAHFRMIEPVGGALAYPRYNFLVRWMLKRIAEKRGEPTDTTRTHETTDWTALDRAMARFFGAFPPVHAHEAHA